ncbi:PREDICTED: cell adhesion molecule 4-like [Sturnus vulgaris]|uniref:cell adhesion molecule 4-like n=1 Tax=Sturnus vulgaris TaxID=9172 RepID=UPI00071A91D9|nr:PREDICTED: cell adhesion molecule 4-like [Sturnus vulgaris]
MEMEISTEKSLKDERFELAEFSRRRLRLRLARARLDDEGGYFCQLYADDTHHQIATLTVLVPPEEPQVEAAALAVEGGELELTCLVPRARPLATLRWYRDRVTRCHPGVTQVPPSARIHPSQAVPREGDTLVLTCATNGNPRPTVAWSRGNESLPARARAEGERLTLPALGPQDNGSYTCQVGNAHGRAADTYVLVVYDPGAVVAAQGAGPFAVVGGAFALLLFLLLLLLGALFWCSVRQKGSYLTHEASGLEEHGEAHRLGSRRCRRCLITFPDAAFAARHAKRQHPRDFAAAALRGALFVCFVCARPFGSSPALLRHQRGHAHHHHHPAAAAAASGRKPAPLPLPPEAAPALACTECGRAFAREGALHRHYIRHARGEL